MSPRRKIEVIERESSGARDPARDPQAGRPLTENQRAAADRRGLRILGEIVLWVAGIGIFLTIGRMLGSTAPGLLAGLKVALLNPVALVLLFGGGFALRIYLRRRRERRLDR